MQTVYLKLRQGVSAILILIMLFTMMAVMGKTDRVAAEELPNPEFALLSHLGIMSDTENDLEYTVTRAQFLSWVLAALNEKIFVNGDTPIFNDVTVNHEFHDEIVYAYNCGYILGSGNKRFYPDDYITREEAAVLLMRAMGYEKVAEAVGSLGAASRTGVFDGVKTAYTEPLTKKDAVLILRNLLDAPYPKTKYASDGTSVKLGSVSFLEKVWNVTEHTGVLEQVGHLSIYGTFEQQNRVIIDGAWYNSQNFDVEAMFGMQIKFYCEEINGDMYIVYAYPINNRVESFTSEEFMGFDREAIRFANGTRTSSYKIGSETTVLWNMRPIRANELEQKLTAKGAEFVLIDSDRNGIYNVVNIMEPQIYAGGFVDLENGKITDKTLPDLELAKYERYIIRDNRGENVLINNLKNEWRYIVYHCGDFEYPLLIIVSNETVDGSITGIHTAENTVSLDSGETYKVSAKAKTPIDELEFGKSYSFYLDTKGCIIDADVTVNAGYQAIYIMASSAGIFGKSKVRALNEKDERVVYELADNVIFRDSERGVSDGIKLTSAEVIARLGGTDVKSRFVFVKLNADGQIKELMQITPKQSEEYRIQEFTQDDTNSKRRWMTATCSLQNQIQLKTGTKIFVVPYADLPMQEDKYYNVRGVGIFSNEESYQINECYPRMPGQLVGTPVVISSDELAADYFVIECPQGSGFEAAETKYGFVTGFMQTYDETEEEAYRVIQLINHNGVDIEVKYDSDSTDYIQVGDIIQINDKGFPVTDSEILIYYDRDQDKINYFSFYDRGTGVNEIGWRYYGWRVTKGRVLRVLGDYAFCEVMRDNANTWVKEYINISSAKIVTLKTDGKDYETRSAKYLKAGDEFLATMNAGKMSYIIEVE